jgi:hypothetical protein
MMISLRAATGYAAISPTEIAKKNATGNEPGGASFEE